MNTTELIEIAEDVADDCIESYCGMYYQFHRDTLKQFAQRIEQPHKQRIAELEKDCDILATNYDAARQASRYTADVADQALADLKAAEKQIEQLREALQGFLDAFNGGYEPSLQTVFIASKAMEQTK